MPCRAVLRALLLLDALYGRGVLLGRVAVAAPVGVVAGQVEVDSLGVCHNRRVAIALRESRQVEVGVPRRAPSDLPDTAHHAAASRGRVEWMAGSRRALPKIVRLAHCDSQCRNTHLLHVFVKLVLRADVVTGHLLRMPQTT